MDDIVPGDMKIYIISVPLETNSSWYFYLSLIKIYENLRLSLPNGLLLSGLSTTSL
jgi:hypothetical protein